MSEKVIKLSNGESMLIKINMLTIKLFLESKTAKKDLSNSDKIDPAEMSEIISEMIYFIMYSNGKKITMEDALALVPVDEEDAFTVLFDEFSQKVELFGKKMEARANLEQVTR